MYIMFRSHSNLRTMYVVKGKNSCTHTHTKGFPALAVAVVAAVGVALAVNYFMKRGGDGRPG